MMRSFIEGNMKLAACVLVLVLGACASVPHADGGFAQGRLISESDGKVVLLQIDGTGRMSGVDPATIEAFHGTYRATADSSDRATAILTGNRGTTFNITMTVKGSGLPTGSGEAIDNAGKKYDVQF